MIVAPRQESRSSGGAGVTSRWTWTSLLVLLALAAGCATAPSRGAGRAPEDGTRPAGAAAVALVGGTLIDGTGAPPRRGTVLIRGGRIA
ncbi:MAG TPA: hypothetical protein VK420_17825, partial [Longimicrobium sp.]|nr:hypothetical protein [Longimicrobium sp.]